MRKLSPDLIQQSLKELKDISDQTQKEIQKSEKSKWINLGSLGTLLTTSNEKSDTLAKLIFKSFTDLCQDYKDGVIARSRFLHQLQPMKAEFMDKLFGVDNAHLHKAEIIKELRKHF
jgi:hypothetical protein